ncbi:MAG TPA: hypothetical protein VH134_18045 [Candidatus Dormibacteraeota bacterium]|nr:hypothetical protein [Candidatus Dormibacteraeota bacterium]
MSTLAIGTPAPIPTASVAPEATAKPTPSPTPCPTGLLNTPCSLPGSSSTTTTSTTEATTQSTLTYAVLPGNVGTIPPTATPKPPPTPSPSPAEITDVGTSALAPGEATTTSQATRASTVINPQSGGDSSSVLPLTVLAFLVVVGGGAIFLITRLR